MDPLSIATGAIALVGTCVTILNFLEDKRNVNQKVASLFNEIEALAKLLKSLEKLAREPSLRMTKHGKANSRQVDLEDVGNWEMVDTTLKDCKDTLDNLAQVLEQVRAVLNVPERVQLPIRALKFQIKNGDIAQYKAQIEGHLRLIQICLQLITVYVPLLIFRGLSDYVLVHLFAATRLKSMNLSAPLPLATQCRLQTPLLAKPQIRLSFNRSQTLLRPTFWKVYSRSLMTL